LGRIIYGTMVRAAQYIVLALLASAPAWAAEDASPLASEAHALLKARCFECHGDGRLRGGLALNARADALQGGDSGKPAFAPGDASTSQIIERITSTDPKTRMPAEGDPLTADEIALLTEWINSGAAYAENAERQASDHWAFNAPVKPEPPRDGHPIDAFIDAKLQTKDLSLAPEADKYSLIRRAHLELIGMPPSPDAVEAFARDDRPDAYERMVDDLLASPHYGERQAQRWLDAARYADTNGYEKDRPRSIWPYRDWVIDAYNANMPFDQFTIEQLAGDLLPDATQSQRIATGFHRNAMLNEEGGIDAAEDWYKRTVDRTDTTGTVFLGLTVSCAQCHSHKYDPITQREYFEFFAFFNDATEETLRLPDPAVDEQRKQIEEKAAHLEAMMVTAGEMNAEETARYRAWAEDVFNKAADWRVENVEVKSANGATMDPLPDGSILATGDIPNDDTYTVEFTLGDNPVSAIRLEVLPHDSLPGGGPGRGVILAEGDFLLTEIQAELRGDSVSTPIAIQSASAGYAKEGREADKALDGRQDTGWSIDGKTGQAHAAVFALEEPIKAPGATLRLTLSQDYIHQFTIGRFRVSTTSNEDGVSATGLPAKLEARVHRVTNPEAVIRDRDIAWHYYVHAAESLNDWRTRRAELLDSRPEHDSTLIMAARETPRPTRIYHRGEFLNPGEPVEPGTPRVLHDWPDASPTNRLGVAEWLVDPANPLMARVTMNRFVATSLRPRPRHHAGRFRRARRRADASGAT
jgi:mono/diheme cytochrome c family protein